MRVRDGRRPFGVRVVAVALPLLWSFAVPAAQETALTPVEQAEFLRTARVIRGRPIGIGVTQPWRLTLTDGRLTHEAAFNMANEEAPMKRFDDGTFETNFVDAYRFNIAAYLLAELVGVGDAVPVTVERTWNSRRGSLTWWVEGAMSEGERLDQGLEPPDEAEWNRQMYRVRVFSNLVHDTDRNLGNMLITDDWRIRMIDFTRAFRLWDKLPGEGDLDRCDRMLLDGLRTLTEEGLDERLGSYLTSSEIEAVIERRDLLVAHFERLIAEQGEADVLY